MTLQPTNPRRRQQRRRGVFLKVHWLLPVPRRYPAWTTQVLPSASACSSTSAPAEERPPVTESDLEKLTKLLEETVVKEEVLEAEDKEAGYWNGVWAEKDQWQPGLWWLFYPGFGWSRWRDFKVTWPIKQFFSIRLSI